MSPSRIGSVLAGLLSIGVFPAASHAQWLLLRWIETAPRHETSAGAQRGGAVEFLPVLSFDKHDDTSWRAARQSLREGDVIAYWKEPWEARREILLQGKLNIIGYRLLRYGHMAMVVRDPDHEDSLRLLSSWSFTGSNIQEDLNTLKAHSWDAYRLNRWDQVDKQRLYEFVTVARHKGEKWYGYDFSGMFGLWNSRLRPATSGEIAHSYICSTVIVAALHYAGVELDVSPRLGIADIVTPLQLVRSKGRIVPVTEVDQERREESQVSTESYAEHSDR